MIKRFKDTHTISREMYEQLNDPSEVERRIKGQSIQRISEQIYNELEPEFYIETNPFVGETMTVDIVAMSTTKWKKIENFLSLNKFDFDGL